MINPEILRYIQDEIRRQMNTILTGEAGTNTQEVEDIDNMYHSMPTVKTRPVMHPYGISSRAPKGTASVIGKIGDHVGAKIVLGHRDKNRPTLNEGEVILYDANGHVVYLSETKMQFGSKTSDEPMLLGNVTVEFLTNVLNAFLNAPNIGLDVFSLPVFLEPAIRTLLNQYKETYLNEASTNIISQLTFTERGDS